MISDKIEELRVPWSGRRVVNKREGEQGVFGGIGRRAARQGAGRGSLPGTQEYLGEGDFDGGARFAGAGFVGGFDFDLQGAGGRLAGQEAQGVGGAAEETEAGVHALEFGEPAVVDCQGGWGRIGRGRCWGRIGWR